MGVNSLPKTASRLRFEPGPFCAWVQRANHSATKPRWSCYKEVIRAPAGWVVDWTTATLRCQSVKLLPCIRRPFIITRSTAHSSTLSHSLPLHPTRLLGRAFQFGQKKFRFDSIRQSDKFEKFIFCYLFFLFRFIFLGLGLLMMTMTVKTCRALAVT